MLPAGFLFAGRYRILQTLGQGGFATVYKARDRSNNNRLVALKQIHLESLSLQEMIDASDAYNREVTHLSSLRHCCLPRIYDHFTDEQHWYIVIEYLAGKTLEEHLKSTRHGFLSVNRTLEIGLALCDVFHYLHMQRPPIIFRDIKPANIMLMPKGRISLIDFGIARLYRPSGKDTSPLGTMGYAAPEQYGRHAHTTPQTDIYGLGATLQTLLTGKEPLEILQDGIPPERARAIPPELQTYLARMLERDASLRPHNMAEVKQALQQIKAQRPVQKIKAACAFVWGLREEVSVFSGISLFLLLLLDLFSITGVVWPLLWPLSLLFLLLLAVVRGRSALRQARAISPNKLTGRETITLLWRQLVSSAPLTFLLYFPFYIVNFFANAESSSNNPVPDMITLAVYVGGVLIAGLIWLIYQLRISRRQAVQHRRQQQPHKLEEPLVQKGHNRP
jgi:serine/threonine protein kinase